MQKFYLAGRLTKTYYTIEDVRETQVPRLQKRVPHIGNESIYSDFLESKNPKFPTFEPHQPSDQFPSIQCTEGKTKNSEKHTKPNIFKYVFSFVTSSQLTIGTFMNIQTNDISINKV